MYSDIERLINVLRLIDRGPIHQNEASKPEIAYCIRMEFAEAMPEGVTMTEAYLVEPADSRRFEDQPKVHPVTGLTDKGKDMLRRLEALILELK